MEDRRNFMMKLAAGMAATSLITVSNKVNARDLPMKKLLAHHVFFWLKDPNNAEDRKAFENRLQALVKVNHIQSYPI
jgi:hypothetical protein